MCLAFGVVVQSGKRRDSKRLINVSGMKVVVVKFSSVSIGRNEFEGYRGRDFCLI